jgi:hypothetical protein
MPKLLGIHFCASVRSVGLKTFSIHNVTLSVYNLSPEMSKRKACQFEMLFSKRNTSRFSKLQNFLQIPF